jgi:hypothetical protein
MEPIFFMFVYEARVEGLIANLDTLLPYQFSTNYFHYIFHDQICNGL